MLNFDLLRDQLANRLRRDVLSGRFKEGEFIRYENLGAMFGVSRTTVRQALLVLKHEGLVVDAKDGMCVAAEPMAGTREFLDCLRRWVEWHALALCFDRLRKVDLKRLQELVESMRRACAVGDHAELVELDVDYHRWFVEKSQQPTLVAVWSVILSGIRRSLRQRYETLERLMPIYEQRDEFVRVLRGSDKEAAMDYFHRKTGHIPYVPSGQPVREIGAIFPLGTGLEHVHAGAY